MSAEFSLKPILAVSEEYTTSVEETSRENRSDWITRAQPGFSLLYLAPRWNWDVGYNLDYRYYDHNSLPDKTNHTGRLFGNIIVIDNLLFIDLSETYQLVSTNIAKNYAVESLTLNQEEQNSAQASAYFFLHPSLKSTLKVGYRYNDTRYFGPTGIDKSEHSAFSDFAYELAPKISLLAGYLYSQNATAINDITKHEVYGGFRYEYADKSFLNGQGGNVWQEYKPGQKVNNPSWKVGITHEFSTATVTLESKAQYTEDPLTTSTREMTHSGKIDQKLARGTLSGSIAYSEYKNIESVSQNRKKLGFNGQLSHDISDGVIGSLNGSAERFSQKSATDYPYRFIINPGVAVALNYGVNLGLNYTYVTYRRALREAAGNNEIHRAIVELRKTF